MHELKSTRAVVGALIVATSLACSTSDKSTTEFTSVGAAPPTHANDPRRPLGEGRRHRGVSLHGDRGLSRDSTGSLARSMARGIRQPAAGIPRLRARTAPHLKGSSR